jgi:KipI family sensor histidine kinase inhibitor
MPATYPRVLPVDDRAVTVELSATLDAETVARVRSLDARVRARALSGVAETVPAYASLLVLYDRERVPFAELRTALLELSRNLESSEGSGRRIEIPALYDGEDLEEVAGACGLTTAAVVELHSSREYTVLMLGFSPGFGYLGFVDERLRVPRRKTPRTRVPMGAIAIAGAQTGVYPRVLPGGWNLLGRTSVRLFDAANPQPSLLMPGDSVRFVPTLTLPETSPSPRAVFTGHGVRVVEPGILSTIQDGGRDGWRRLAVPRAGFADRATARRANRCLGRPEDAAVIEICGPGLRLAFDRATFVAITGPRVNAVLERGDLEGGRMTVPMNVAVRVRAGNALTVTGIENGARGYVAIAGMEAPAVLGSASVDPGSGFLRPLEAGDSFEVGPVDADGVRRDPAAVPPRRDTVRVILGPQADHFDEQTIETFLRAAWTVGLDSDRVGARLNGATLVHRGPTEIVSDGMVPGCIQVPPDGRPIVMLSDCPTTGGYPKIACVLSDDLGIVAQAEPGKTSLRFEAVAIEGL